MTSSTRAVHGLARSIDDIRTEFPGLLPAQ